MNNKYIDTIWYGTSTAQGDFDLQTGLQKVRPLLVIKDYKNGYVRVIVGTKTNKHAIQLQIKTRIISFNPRDTFILKKDKLLKYFADIHNKKDQSFNLKKIKKKSNSFFFDNKNRVQLNELIEIGDFEKLNSKDKKTWVNILQFDEKERLNRDNPTIRMSRKAIILHNKNHNTQSNI